jgi:hypothetical protein
LTGGFLRTLGLDSDAAKAVDALEAKPESDGRKGTLSEEITAAKADHDPDLLAAAQALAVVPDWA